MTTLTIHDYATVNSIAGSAYAADSLHKLRKDLHSSTAMPDFTDLFKNLENRAEVAHEDSIVSPAAYLADLMRMVKTQSGVPEGDPRNLFTRRADLLTIPLDAENTTKEEPYLEVVNGILIDLLNRVEGRNAGDKTIPLQDLAVAQFPTHLPYHAPIENVRAYLEHFKSSLPDLMQLYGPTDRSVTGPALNMNGAEIQRITTTDFSPKSLCERYGAKSSAIDYICFTQFWPSQEHLKNNENTFFVRINNERDGAILKWYTDGKFFEWSTWVTGSLTNNLEFYEDSKVFMAWANAIVFADQIFIKFSLLGEIEQRFVTRVREEPFIVEHLRPLDQIAAQLQTDPSQVLDAIYQRRRPRITSPKSKDPQLYINRILTEVMNTRDEMTEHPYADSFHIGEANGELDVYAMTKLDTVQPDGTTYQISSLSQEYYSKSYNTSDDQPCMRLMYDILDRFIRLAHKLNWSFSDLDWVLSSVGGKKLDHDALEGVAQVKALQTRLNLPLDQLVAMWGTLQHDGTSKSTDDLFHRIYGFDWKKCAKSAWNKAPENIISNTISPAWLKAALQIGEEDLRVLVDYLVETKAITRTNGMIDGQRQNYIKCSYDHLCAFYRPVMLARAMDRPLAETLKILRCCDIEFINPDGLAHLLAVSDWLKTASIDVTTWEHMIHGVDKMLHYETWSNAITAALRANFTQSELHLNAADKQILEYGPINKKNKQKADDKLQVMVYEMINTELLQQFDIDRDLMYLMIELIKSKYGYRAMQDDLRALAIDSPGEDYSRLAGSRMPIMLCMSSLATMATTLKLPADLAALIKTQPVMLGINPDLPNGYTSAINIIAVQKAIALTHPFDDDWHTILSAGLAFYNTGKKNIRGTTLGNQFDQLSEKLAKKLDCPRSWTDKVLVGENLFHERVPKNVFDSFGVVAALSKVKDKIDLAKRIGVDPNLLWSVAHSINDDMVNFTSAVERREVWGLLDGYSQQLFEAARAKYEPNRWPAIQGPIAGKLLEKLRDALTSRVIWRLNQADVDQKWLPLGPPSTLEDLSDMLLVDVEMSGVATISKIKLGLNTLQRYIQRCHMGLEYPARLPIGDKEWVWRSHYRLWEANRKVFLFPENYLDPNLRRRKTPLYEALQQDLMQGEITEEAVTQAYLNYFERLEKLADLEITSTSYESISVPNDASRKNTIFMVGRTHTDPTEFYFRSVIYDTMSFSASPEPTEWKPWEKIPLTIHSASVGCAYMNHRLYIFWTEQKTTKDRDAKDEKTVQTHATVKYSWLKVNGSWMAPQDFKPLTNVLIGDAIIKVDNYLSLMQFTDRQGDFPPGKPKRPLFMTAIPGAEPHLPIAHASFSRAQPLANNYVPLNDARVEVENRAGVNNHYTLAKSSYQNANAPDTSWEEKGSDLIYGKSVSHILTSSDGRGMFAGVANQGIYYSPDGGESWGHTTPVSLIDMSPSVLANGRLPGTVLTCFKKADGEPQMHRTRDNFKTWTLVGPENTTIKTIVMLQDGKTLFAAGNQGAETTDVFLLSQDDGEHWHISTGPTNTLDTGFPYTQPASATLGPWDRQLFISGHFFYRGIEDGKWEQVADNLRSSYVFHPTLCAHGWMAVSAYFFLYMSRESGNPMTWHKQFSVPGDANINAIERGSDGTILLGTSNGLYMSGTNGGSFEKVSGLEINGSKNVVVTSIAIGPDGTSIFIGCYKFGDNTTNNTIMRLSRARNWVTINVLDPYGGAPYPSLCAENKSGDKHFSTLASKAVPALSEKLLSGGLDKLLSLNTQREELDVNGAGDPVPIDFSPTSAFSMYYHEVFFHIPALIADTLNANQKFKEAQQWYHRIFKPVDANPGAPGEHSYWQYLPFKEHTAERLEVNLAKYPQEFAIYSSDPFDPHAIADLRPGAYEKAIVMKYIDNLLDWGDSQFRLNGWESNVQATILYKIAQDLLGKRPAKPTKLSAKRKVMNFTALQKSETGSYDKSDTFHLADMAYFHVPQNDNFTGYWDRANDRLYKIRHSLDIEGIARHLALFQPEIDPASIIAALAGGQGLGDVPNHPGGAVPQVRFTTALAQAKEVAGNLIQLGQSLLAALEKKDAAHLSMIQATHQRAIFELSARIKAKNVEEADKHLDGLNVSLDAAKTRVHYYEQQLSQGYLAEERSNITCAKIGLGLHAEAAALNALSSPVYLIPEIFGLADGGSSPGSALQSAAAAVENGAEIASTAGQLAMISAENKRRIDEWGLQRDLAHVDIDQIGVEIEAAKIHADILQLDIDMHDKNQAQSQEMAMLLRDRFTNEALYNWMVRQISGVFFQTYRLAFDLAKSAEAAYKFECNAESSQIIHASWDSLHKGLLAGETLMLGLNQLENAWTTTDPHLMQIEKTISLKVQEGDIATKLRTGAFVFNLSEREFDADFPGHYCRKIKSIAISIPAMIGPYQDIHATLTQTTNRLIKTADIVAVKALSKSSNLTSGVFVSGREAQKVILSHPVRDTGLFEPYAEGPHYKPFEGTGAVSSWKLELNPERDAAILKSVTDIIVHLRYTAKAGNSAFREEVKKIQTP